MRFIAILFFIASSLLSAQNADCSIIKTVSPKSFERSVNEDLWLFVNDCFDRLNVSPPENLVVLEESGSNNCHAGFRYGRPFMSFDINWLNDIRLRDDWNSIFIIGHEIGHLIERHYLEEPNKNQEYEADIWGAYLISKFGYPNEIFNRDYPDILLNMPEGETHPSGRNRLQKINEFLQNKDRNILSQFGSFGFHINKWNNTDQTKHKKLNESLYRLEHEANRANITDVLENINYCEGIIVNTTPNIIRILQYGLLLEVITAEKAFQYVNGILNLNNSRQIGVDIFRLFINNYEYFSKLIPNIDIEYYIELVNDETSGIQSRKDASSMLLEMKIREEKHRYLLKSFDMNSTFKALMTEENMKDTEFISALVIYNNFIGDYETSEIISQKSVNIWVKEFIKNNSSSKTDNWSSEMLSISYHNLGLAQYRLKKYREANNTLYSSLKYTNKNTQSEKCYYILARSNFALRGYQESLYYIDKCKIDNDAYELKVRGQVYLANGMEDKAHKDFERSCMLGNKWSCTKLSQL